MDSVSIRAPYRNLKKEVEVEMVGVEDQHHHLIQLDNSPSSSSPNSASHIPNGDSSFSVRSKTNGHFSLITLILSCTVAASVQFGWALQLSLLTPYIQVIIIGFSADIGYILGDTKEHCSTFKGTRTRAAFVFVIGFWLLDLANNTVQGPARALLADLSVMSF